MRRLSLAALTALLLSALVPAHAGAKDFYELQIDMGVRNNEAYSHTLIGLAMEDAENKDQFLSDAVKHSPDIPAFYFELAKAALPNLFKSVAYMTQGFKAYWRNFWWSLSLIGTLYFGAVVSFVFAAAALLLIRLPQSVPLMMHDIDEDRKKLLIPLLLIPLSFMGPLFFLAGAFFVVGLYLRKTDKGVVYAVMLLLLLSPLFLRLGNILISAPTSKLRAIVAVNEGRGNKYALLSLPGEEDFESRFSYALALKREGIFEEAISQYESIDSKKKDIRSRVNLGNTYAAAGEMDFAKSTYENTLEINPTVTAYYNLSKVYRSTFNFPKGDDYYAKAMKLDRDRVLQFDDVAGTHYNRFVMDETLNESEFWQIAMQDSERVINPFPVNPYTASALSIAILVLFIVVDKQIAYRARRCSRCGAVFCAKCVSGTQWGEMCHECYNSLVKPQEQAPKDRVSKLLTIHEKRNRARGVIRVLSYTLPGLAQIYSGKALSGIVFLWLFLFPITVLVLSPFLSVGLSEYSHSPITLPLTLLSVLLYFISNFSIRRRLQKGWL